MVASANGNIQQNAEVVKLFDAGACRKKGITGCSEALRNKGFIAYFIDRRVECPIF